MFRLWPGYTHTMTTAHVAYLAHHGLLLAIPAFLPAVILVGVVLYAAIRDRRNAGDGTSDDSDQRTNTSDDTRD
uniref:Uncharacterized protein n=2 Tax=Mycobacterium riyadhense TaxID=486698 RepID=A0A653EQB3_9MYCO|nr:hypothetical protein BIN_B_03151 [Mycobacterium riyadhense]